MEQLENFGPNDVQNGRLDQMFRQIGINDVQTYVNDIRRDEQNNFSNSKKFGLSNIKQIYQMVKFETNEQRKRKN